MTAAHDEGEAQPGMWAVATLMPNGEGLAERSVLALGYEPLVVRYNKLIKGARIAANGRRIRSRDDHLEPRPFLPGYMFILVQHDDDATTIDGANGIRRLLRYRDADGYLAKPKLVRGRIIEQIREAALAKDETPKAKRSDIKPGDRVRIPGGIEAVLISLDDKGRARYMAELMGVEVPGSIEDADALELVGG